ncbi:MAG: hypothetical protein WBD79_04310 [Anaerolineae bacterium]
MTPNEIRGMMRSAGWKEKAFPNTGVVAMHPLSYADWNLGLTGRWIDAGYLGGVRGLRLWLYPIHDTLQEIMDEVQKS